MLLRSSLLVLIYFPCTRFHPLASFIGTVSMRYPHRRRDHDRSARKFIFGTFNRDREAAVFLQLVDYSVQNDNKDDGRQACCGVSEGL